VDSNGEGRPVALLGVREKPSNDDSYRGCVKLRQVVKEWLEKGRSLEEIKIPGLDYSFNL